MRRFRRRRPRVAWLPNTGTQYSRPGAPALQATENPSFLEFSFTPALDSAITVEAPMVTDQPTPSTLEQTGVANVSQWQLRGLNETEQKGYRLRRIVGDIFGAISPNNTSGQINTAAIYLSCGIMVRRVDEETGAAVEPGTGQDVNTLRNNADPWVWRRNWVLGNTFNPAAGNNVFTALSQFPTTTAGYGTSRQAVDQKTSRILSQAERLIFNVTAWLLPTSTAAAEQNLPVIWVLFDYRVLASLFISAGNRRNATR